MARARASSHYLKFGNSKVGGFGGPVNEEEKKGAPDGEPLPETADGETAPADDGAVEAPCPEGDVECEDAKMTLENVEELDLSKYYETLSLGVIDGFVSSFNANC